MPKRKKTVSSESENDGPSDSESSHVDCDNRAIVTRQQKQHAEKNNETNQKMALRTRNKRVKQASPDPICHLCLLTGAQNPDGVPEDFLSCTKCGKSVHPSCGNFPMAVVQKTKSYSWHCQKCKICDICKSPGDETNLICCSACDRGFHLQCLKPPLKQLPKGSWTCPPCNGITSNVNVNSGVIPGTSIKADNEIFSTEMSTDSEAPIDNNNTRVHRLTRSMKENLMKEKDSESEAMSEVSSVTRPCNLKNRKLQDTESESESENVQIHKKVTRRKTRNRSQINNLKDTDSESENDQCSNSHQRGSAKINRKSGYTSGTDSERSVSRRRKKFLTHGSRKSAVPREELMEMQRQIMLEKEEKKCPVTGCDSSGHLSGRFSMHTTVFACPVYHNLRPEDCKKKFEESQNGTSKDKKLNVENSLNCNDKSSVKRAAEQKERLAAFLTIRKAFVEPKDTTQLDNKFVQEGTLDKSKQPSIEGLAPEFDVNLFKSAQAKAAGALEDQFQCIRSSVKGLKSAEMGRYEMDVWYQAPYPDEFTRLSKIYLCEFCLKYMRSATILRRHVVKCVWRHPPGDEIYRKGHISVFEVDGQKNKIYCQNLCLLAKLFLDHKTLYFDVEPFLFYVMIESDNEGCHMIGYFSKEKNSFLNYNVSCILTLPPYQRQGYGRLLIDFSYLLTKVEQKIGSPEKPLSDLGLISYRSYWKTVLLDYLSAFDNKEISIKDLSQETAINSYDIVSTLQALGMIKYWKGRHIVLKRQDILDEHRQKMKRRVSDPKTIDGAYLRWRPYIPVNRC